MYQRFVKRMLDVILSLCGVVLLSPVFLILAVWIKLDSPGPVFFKQKRVGKHKTYFNILKFRRSAYIKDSANIPDLGFNRNVFI